MKIKHISVSRKGCYETCPQKYKYQYHLEIEVDKPEPVYFTYGSIVHKIVEIYVGEKGKRPIQEVAKSLLAGEIMLEHDTPSPPVPKQYRAKFDQHLQNLERLTKRLGFDGELEWSFKYDLEPPNNKFVHGFIDRLIIRDDKYFILDYKTTKAGRWQKTPQTIRNDIQIRTYARVVQKVFGAKAENIKAALYYIDNNKLVAAAFNDAMLMETEKELLKTYNRIEQDNPDNVLGRTGEHCSRCEFNDICPFYSLTGKGIR